MYEQNRDEYDEVDNRRHNGHCDWDEGERVVAFHGCVVVGNEVEGRQWRLSDEGRDDGRFSVP